MPLYGQTLHPCGIFQITSDYQYENISDWCIFRLDSDGFQIYFRLCKEFQIVSSDFILLQIVRNYFSAALIESAVNASKTPPRVQFRLCHIESSDFR